MARGKSGDGRKAEEAPLKLRGLTYYFFRGLLIIFGCFLHQILHLRFVFFYISQVVVRLLV